jgi:hypothetical protein
MWPTLPVPLPDTTVIPYDLFRRLVDLSAHRRVGGGSRALAPPTHGRAMLVLTSVPYARHSTSW